MKSNYEYLMELKKYPLGNAVLDSVIKKVSPFLSSTVFNNSDGEIDLGINLCTEQFKSTSNGCAECPVSNRCNHVQKDGYISWLTVPIDSEGGLKLCQA